MLSPKRFTWLILLLLVFTTLFSGCQQSSSVSGGATDGLKVIAVETFLADIAQNVAGDRVKVESLIPAGLDPHAFEPTPLDITRVAQSQVLIINGAGLEAWLSKVLDNVGGQRQVIEAAAGLTSRLSDASEPVGDNQAGNPHFWMNPLNVIQYVQNIRDGLSLADPAGKVNYSRNADLYINRLKDLDAWIAQQVAAIPPAERLLVTDHEDLGYFADRYGFKIIGTILPGTSSESSPSAQQIANLIKMILQSGVPAIFLETGTDPRLADQIAAETKVKVVNNLYTHSLTSSGGKAPTYIDMMRYDTQIIVEALAHP